MNTRQALLFSISLMMAGMSCSNSAEKSTVKFDPQDYNIQQIKALQKYHQLQREIYSKYHLKKAEDKKAWSGQTEEQRASLENIKRIEQVFKEQQEAEEALLKGEYDP
ncbi:MAG: hypothetical protein HQM13_05685 [SAR324 cluster bacterium]|nr:hypothetical protein [SAR324 cluster bacterium]